MSRRVFISVAEHSADEHAAELVRAMRSLEPDLEVHAIGGSALRSAGATIRHDTVAGAAMGLRAFARAAELKRVLKETTDWYRQTPVDLAICCDSWTMNKHFARAAKDAGIPVLYYIAPQAWASREGRVRELARVADRLACILPFEEKWFRDRGVDATFVGHPLFDRLPAHEPGDDTTRSPETAPVIGLPCGSRRSIAHANFPRQLEVARQIRDDIPGARFVVPTTGVTHPVVGRLIRGLDWIEARQDSFDDVVAGCDLCITVSGTATLHIAAHGVPMIVVYAGSPILWHGLGRWMIKTRTFAMVNLLANDGVADASRHIVPEFIPWYGSTQPVADYAAVLLRDPALLQEQRDALAKVVASIRRPGASMNAAGIAIDLMNRRGT